MTASPPPIDLPTGILIGGDWSTSASGGTLDHVNPATGRVQASFPAAGRAEVDAAVAAAAAAGPVYRAMPPVERRAVMLRLVDLLRQHQQELADVATLESGILAPMAATGAGHAAGWMEYYAGWTDKVTGSVVPTTGFDYTLREPVGVVAVLLTWNAPTASLGPKLAAVLAAGCTLVLKPPELSPFGSVLFGRLCLEAGFPPGTVNVVPGGPEAGDALVRNEKVAKITFTGGPHTARRIQAACAEALTPCLFELGGKSANVIFPSADVDAAIAHAARTITTLAGQVCHAPSRLLVHESVYDQVVEGVGEQLSGIRVGDPFDPASQMGPVIGQAAHDRISAMVDRARDAGSGEIVTGGERVDLDGGFYLRPTLFRDVDPTSEIAREEVFGPVLAATPFADEDEAVALTNDSPYGLAAHLHTHDLDQAHRVASAVDVGNVAINGGLAYAGPIAPFGGVKASGYGREGGREGIEEFMRVKNVNIQLR